MSLGTERMHLFQRKLRLCTHPDRKVVFGQTHQLCNALCRTWNHVLWIVVQSNLHMESSLRWQAIEELEPQLFTRLVKVHSGQGV